MEYTVDQPNEDNSTLSEAIAYWEKRAYHFTMLWGRERIQNPWSQISPKFAVIANAYYAHKLTAESELDRLLAIARKPYVSPLMKFVAFYTLIGAAINMMHYELLEPTLTIKHSNKLPVTMINPSSGNDRVIRYCVVKAYKRNPLLGRITVDKKSRKVTRRILSNGQYSQWELI